MADAKNKRKNFVFPAELVKWAEEHAQKNNTTLTRIILDHLTELRRQTETEYVDQI